MENEITFLEEICKLSFSDKETPNRDSTQFEEIFWKIRVRINKLTKR